MIQDIDISTLPHVTGNTGIGVIVDRQKGIKIFDRGGQMLILKIGSGDLHCTACYENGGVELTALLKEDLVPSGRMSASCRLRIFSESANSPLCVSAVSMFDTELDIELCSDLHATVGIKDRTLLVGNILLSSVKNVTISQSRILIPTGVSSFTVTEAEKRYGDEPVPLYNDHVRGLFSSPLRQSTDVLDRLLCYCEETARSCISVCRGAFCGGGLFPFERVVSLFEFFVAAGDKTYAYRACRHISSLLKKDGKLPLYFNGESGERIYEKGLYNPSYDRFVIALLEYERVFEQRKSRAMLRLMSGCIERDIPLLRCGMMPFNGDEEFLLREGRVISPFCGSLENTARFVFVSKKLLDYCKSVGEDKSLSKIRSAMSFAEDALYLNFSPKRRDRAYPLLFNPIRSELARIPKCIFSRCCSCKNHRKLTRLGDVFLCGECEGVSTELYSDELLMPEGYMLLKYFELDGIAERFAPKLPDIKDMSSEHLIMSVKCFRYDEKMLDEVKNELLLRLTEENKDDAVFYILRFMTEMLKYSTKFEYKRKNEI